MKKVTILELFSIYQNTINNYSHQWGIPVHNIKRSLWIETQYSNGNIIELNEIKDGETVKGYCLLVLDLKEDEYLELERVYFEVLDSKYYA
tara:strand:- start:578 stop:850 length:273 start_codon:yes stop_codon:yes gene_type:complete